ncbi:hypothetical protein UYSO10_1797 [Kosakonia radicincitans]|nr:hypothetical protein UYSO10_1797 [Kosakonia radicincitans]
MRCPRPNWRRQLRLFCLLMNSMLWSDFTADSYHQTVSLMLEKK